jgi:cbb3-type cytochrome oxidase subunit 3
LNPAVNVLALTILVSSCLAGIFICCFAAEYRRCRNKSLERDSLLPLNDAPGNAKPKANHS